MISGQMLRNLMQNSLKITKRDDDDDDGDDDTGDHVEDTRDINHEQYVKCYTVELRGRSQPWIKHVGGTHHDSESTSSTWMATLLHSLRFRLVDNNNNNNVPLSHSPRPPSQCLIYVLDSDIQAAAVTSGSCFKPETGSDRSTSVVSQSQNEVESPTLKNLPDLTSSTCSSSLRTVGNSRQRLDPRDQSDVTSADTAIVYPKPNCLQSPPLAARYPLRRKIQTAGQSTSLGGREPDKQERPPTMKEPRQPPPLPARRENLPSTSHVRAHLEPPMTSLQATPSIIPVEPREESVVGQHASETSQDDGDDNDELNYKVDVCGTSMLEYVLQAGNSLSQNHDDDDDDDDAISQQLQKQQQQQQKLNNDNSNVGSDDREPLTTNSSGLNFLDVIGTASSSNLEVIHQSLHVVFDQSHTLHRLTVVFYYTMNIETLCWPLCNESVKIFRFLKHIIFGSICNIQETVGLRTTAERAVVNFLGSENVFNSKVSVLSVRYAIHAYTITYCIM